MESYLIWFIIGLVFLFAELVLPGFIIFFFGIGGLITSLLTYIFGIDSVMIQIIIFIVTSLLSLILLRRIFNKLFRGNVDTQKDFLDEFVGKKAIVVNEIKPNSLKGKIEFNGTHWEADSDYFIDKDSVVEIIARRNLTLIVKPIE